ASSARCAPSGVSNFHTVRVATFSLLSTVRSGRAMTAPGGSVPDARGRRRGPPPDELPTPDDARSLRLRYQVPPGTVRTAARVVRAQSLLAPPVGGPMSYAPKDATPITATANREARALYALDDVEDFETSRRGFVAWVPGGKILLDDGRVSYDTTAVAFLDDDASDNPDTVNPSLWRQAKVIHEAGLYRVTDRIYQFRNADIANLTIVVGDGGLVVVDCASSVEFARTGMAVFREHVTDLPVVAVIYTHTHIDHYGGVKGVIDEEDVASGQVPIIAPGTIASFDKYAIGENVVAGNAMSRRASYAFGSLLDRDPRQFVSSGIGSGTADGPTVSYLSPTDPITE